jgi:hypothetical protein
MTYIMMPFISGRSIPAAFNGQFTLVIHHGNNDNPTSRGDLQAVTLGHLVHSQLTIIETVLFLL